MIKATANILEFGSKLAANYVTKEIPSFHSRHWSIILLNHNHVPSCPAVYQVREFVIDHSTLKGINITHSESNKIK